MSNINEFKQETEILGVNINDEGLESLNEMLFQDFQKNLEEEGIELELEKEINEIKEETSKFDIEQAVYDYLNGQQESFDYIHNYYRPKLERLAYRKNDDELTQELSIVLYHAIQKFDILADVKFNTFFWACAQNHIGTQNIRKNAQKRSGAKKVEVTEINPETGEEEVITKVIKTKVVSLQSTLKNKDTETEVGNFIENNYTKNDFKKLNLELSLKQLADNQIISYKEMTAIKMIVEGATLHEIGQALGDITAPAVHVMLRRLGKKKHIGNYLRDILS